MCSERKRQRAFIRWAVTPRARTESEQFPTRYDNCWNFHRNYSWKGGKMEWRQNEMAKVMDTDMLQDKNS